MTGEEMMGNRERMKRRQALKALAGTTGALLWPQHLLAAASDSVICCRSGRSVRQGST